MITEFDTCFVDNFDLSGANQLKEKMRHVWWKGNVTCPPSVGENSSQTTHLLLGFNEIEELYHCEFMGWEGLW